MLISLNWIKDFVAIADLKPREIASAFTLSTAEVEDVILKGEVLKAILCVEIKSLRPHPDSDKLNLVTFDMGGGNLKEVVCGAGNVRVGLKVPYAPIGTTLPNGMTLEPKKIRGVLSDGMLCSEQELGLGEGKGGLMELSSEAVAGKCLADYLKMTPDIVLDVDNKSLTHRPDLWGHFGLAREFAASHAVEFKNPFSPSWEKSVEASFTTAQAPVAVEIHPDSSCHAFCGLALNLSHMGETPAIIRERLEVVGLRPINLLVDISNYVMLELGIPNHIYDRSKIKGDKIVVQKPKQALTFKTLDGIDRDLIESDTVIFDQEQPLVLGGIMGGAAASVDPTTTQVFLEVANWEASEVRKTSVRLGLRTDSSQRFEKTLDSQLCYRSLIRLTELILKYCPGSVVVGRPFVYLREDKLARPITLHLSHEQIIKNLGMEISAERVTDIFKRLDFLVSFNQGIFEVTIPTFRTTKDISVKEDLIEEIGRLIGYDNIPSVSPLMPLRPVRLSTSKIFHRKVQDFLVFHAKCLQVMTYPLVGQEQLQRASWPELNQQLILVNALSHEQDRMRPSLIPSAIEVVAANQKNFEEFSFFEIGRSYLGFENERSQLVVGMYSKNKTRFVELENVIEKLLSSLNINYQFSPLNTKFSNPLMDSNWSGMHPNEFLNIQVMGKYMGVLNTLHPVVMKNFKMKGYFSFAVIDLTEIENKEMKDKIKYSPLAKFPTSTFEVTVVMDKNSPSSAALTALGILKAKEIKSKSITDVFIMDDAKKAVSMRMVFEDREKTLAPETIKDLESKIIQTLEKAGFFLRT